MNTREAAARRWLETPAGKVYAALHGGEFGALAHLAQLEQADEASAVAYQDAREAACGIRPDLGTARAVTRGIDPAMLTGATAEVVRALNRDPSWRCRADAEPGPAAPVVLQ